MAYLFPYAGYDGPRIKRPRQPTDAKYLRRKATKALRTLEAKPELPPQKRAELEAAINSEYLPSASSGLPASYRKILGEVAIRHKVPYKSILGIARNVRISTARREFMFRCMEEIESASYAGVGRYTKRDHSTVMYAHQKGLSDPSSLDPIPPKITPQRVGNSRTNVRFTDIEHEVIRLTKMGLEHTEIAERMGKTPKAIINLLYEIRQKIPKLGCDLPLTFGRVKASYL